MNSVILSKKKKDFIKRKHPWIFSGAIKNVDGNPECGETIKIISPEGDVLGVGAYSPHSQIRVRIWSFNPDEKIDKDFFRRKIELAINYRKELNIDNEANCYRLFYSESDGLPGLIVDKYNSVLVCQFLSCGVEFWKSTITEILYDLIKPEIIYERSDSDVRKKEGLSLIQEALVGKKPVELIEVKEGKIKFLVDIINGHKTGLYLDQRINRKIISEYAKGKTVLNCFSYTGGFGMWALCSDAEKVINVDASADALSLSNKNFELNKFDKNKYEHIQGDVFELLRDFKNQNKNFDLIILDPPKFIHSKSNLIKASRGYKDINMLAFSILNPGGLLATFSCSGLLNRDLFQKIVSDAALDANVEAQIIQYLNQSSDHPVSLNFPEASYLKGLICRIK